MPEPTPAKLTSANATTFGGGVGGALGVIVVVMTPKIFTGFTFDATEASIMTAALGAVFAWGIRYIPKPKNGSIP